MTMFQYTDPNPARQAVSEEVDAAIAIPCIKVLGLGGGGSNAVNRMIELGLTDVEFIAANTDRQALRSSLAPTHIVLGPHITRGLGAGGDPMIGESAAKESRQEIAKALRGADLVFITAGMGGGTGTGSAPVAAEIAAEIGAVVVSIVTMPFSFEMGRRAKTALQGVRRLQPHSHTLICVPNDRLLEVVPHDLSLEVAFRVADDVLRQGVQTVSELVTKPGLINVDFAHVRNLMLNGGGALMSIGLGEGGDKAIKAIHQAVNHPLLAMDSLEHAGGALVHFTGGEDLTLFEVGEAITALRDGMDPEADIILGATTDDSMLGRVQVILIVTGLGGKPVPAAMVSAAGASTPEGEPDPSTEQDDLDLPTFLRRRLKSD
jgi:cell division protein FtsZ